MAIPIRHTDCGEIAMWYVGDKSQSAMRSKDIVYLDGTRPAYVSMVPKCPACGGGMYPRNLKRCFNEDVDTGFDVEEAVKNGKRVSLVGIPDPAMVSLLLSQRNVVRWILAGAAILFISIVVAALIR